MSTETARPAGLEAEVVEHDQLLVRQALAGDAAAGDELVARLLPVVRSRARRARARDPRQKIPDTVDDMIQEVWLVLVGRGGERLRAWDPDRGLSLERYVGLVAEREITRLRTRAAAQKRGGHLRALGSDALDSMTTPNPSPEEGLLARDLAAHLGAHLQEALPTRGQLVFRHAYTDGRSPNEVARLMGVKVQVVYNWQHKIRELTRAFLGD